MKTTLLTTFALSLLLITSCNTKEDDVCSLKKETSFATEDLYLLYNTICYKNQLLYADAVEYTTDKSKFPDTRSYDEAVKYTEEGNYISEYLDSLEPSEIEILEHCTCD